MILLLSSTFYTPYYSYFSHRAKWGKLLVQVTGIQRCTWSADCLILGCSAVPLEIWQHSTKSRCFCHSPGVFGWQTAVACLKSCSRQLPWDPTSLLSIQTDLGSLEFLGWCLKVLQEFFIMAKWSNMCKNLHSPKRLKVHEAAAHSFQTIKNR